MVREALAVLTIGILLAGLGLALGATVAPAQTNDPIAVINLERQRAGVPALAPDARLTRVALGHINRCIERGSMGHVSDIAGVPLLSLLADEGYEPVEATDLGGTGRQPAGLHWVDPNQYGPGYTGPTHFSELRNPRYVHVGYATGGGQNVTIYARPGPWVVTHPVPTARPVAVPSARIVPESYRVEYLAVRPGADLAIRVRPIDGRAGPTGYVLLNAQARLAIEGKPADRSRLLAWVPTVKEIHVTVKRGPRTYGLVTEAWFRDGSREPVRPHPPVVPDKRTP